MKKCTPYLLIVLLVSCQATYSATVTENMQYTFQRVMSTLRDYFYHVFGYHKTTPVTFEEPTPVDTTTLSPFQQFFRKTITVTQETKNLVAATARHIIDQSRGTYLSAQQIGEKFISDLMTANKNFVTQTIKDTMHIDLALLLPALQAIQEHSVRLQKSITPLERIRIKNQIIALTNYLALIQKNITDLQQAGIVKVSAAIAAKALTGYEQDLVKKFNEVYTAYPKIIEHINNFKIAGPGKIMQSAFNRASELIEQVIILHQSTGTIGSILVQKEIIEPLKELKNHLRKLGNTIEYTTTTHPIIVVAPPTTYDALLAILKTFVFDEGFQIRNLVMQDITTLNNLYITLNHKIQLLLPALTALQQDTATLPKHIEDQFITSITAAPLRAIPRAPMVLYEIVEAQFASIKKQLNFILNKSALCIKNLSDMLGTTAHFLPYINQCMGATEQTPFVNPKIIRGIDFIAEDTGQISTIIDAINDGIENYSLRIPNV